MYSELIHYGMIQRKHNAPAPLLDRQERPARYLPDVVFIVAVVPEAASLCVKAVPARVQGSGFSF